MTRTAKFLALGLALGLLGLTGCSGQSTPTVDANAVYTQAAGTVQAALTSAAAQTPSATPTTAPTSTTEPTQAATEAPTAASSPSSQPSPVVVMTATQALSPDRAIWVSQSPADGATYNPGDTFTMTWKVKNTGTTTWSTSYLLRFYAGDQMAGAATVAFPKTVAPNDTVELSVPLKAPSNPGKYLGNWVLTNADGVNFYPVTIQITVNTAPTATKTNVPATATSTQAATATSTAEPTATPTP